MFPILFSFKTNILGAELVGPSKRVLIGSIVSALYPVGEILTAGVAYGFKAFRPTVLALYAPSLFFPILFFCLPDSVRWLLAEGKNSEAKRILKRAAKVNGKTISDETLNDLTIND